MLKKRILHLTDPNLFKNVQTLPVITTISCILLLTVFSNSQAAPPADSVINYTPGLTLSQLADKPDSTLLTLSSGKRVKLKNLRKLEQAQKRIRGVQPGSMLPQAFKLKPNPNNIKLSLRSKTDLANALKLTDTDTVRLPSGKLTTVAILRHIAPLVKAQSGIDIHQITPRAELTGKAIKAPDASDKARWQEIFSMPQTTILEAPDGSRITLRELTDHMGQLYGRSTSPSSSTK